MAPKLHIGDVIRRAREDKRWNQERLGIEAGKYLLKEGQTKIDKSTVSKVETDPFSSELGTIYRLLSALNLSLSDVEAALGQSAATGHLLPVRGDPALEQRAAKGKRTG